MFSDKIQPLIKNKNFPLNATAIQAFKTLQKRLENVTLQNNEEELPFVIECDTLQEVVSATLNQTKRPVAFMTRTLQGSELHYQSIGKEGTASSEAVRKWNHLLARQR